MSSCWLQVGALITGELQSPLCHVALLCQNRGTPSFACRNWKSLWHVTGLSPLFFALSQYCVSSKREQAGSARGGRRFVFHRPRPAASVHLFQIKALSSGQSLIVFFVFPLRCVCSQDYKSPSRYPVPSLLSTTLINSTSRLPTRAALRLINGMLLFRLRWVCDYVMLCCSAKIQACFPTPFLANSFVIPCVFFMGHIRALNDKLAPLFAALRDADTSSAASTSLFHAPKADEKESKSKVILLFCVALTVFSRHRPRLCARPSRTQLCNLLCTLTSCVSWFA